VLSDLAIALDRVMGVERDVSAARREHAEHRRRIAGFVGKVDGHGAGPSTGRGDHSADRRRHRAKLAVSERPLPVARGKLSRTAPRDRVEPVGNRSIHGRRRKGLERPRREGLSGRRLRERQIG